VRCIDGSWWQIRQIGANGVSLTTESGARLPVAAGWSDVPARYGVSYVTVTTAAEIFEFKVEPGADVDVATGAVAPSSTHGATKEIETRVVPRVGYWRVAVALCEPALRDGSERVPTNLEIVSRLDGLALEPEGFTIKAVERRIRHLYDVTAVEPGDRAALRRRLVDAQVVTLDDVVGLLHQP
jgi:hypothetical protein